MEDKRNRGEQISQGREERVAVEAIIPTSKKKKNPLTPKPSCSTFPFCEHQSWNQQLASPQTGFITDTNYHTHQLSGALQSPSLLQVTKSCKERGPEEQSAQRLPIIFIPLYGALLAHFLYSLLILGTVNSLSKGMYLFCRLLGSLWTIHLLFLASGHSSVREHIPLLLKPPARLLWGRVTHLESCCMVGHGPANPLVTAVLLDVSNPLLTLGHDLHSFQVKVFMYNLKNKPRQRTKGDQVRI